MIEVEMTRQPDGGWTLSLKGSNQIEARGPTALSALGKFVRGNQEVLGVDWIEDDPDGEPLGHEALGALVAKDPEQFGVHLETVESPG